VPVLVLDVTEAEASDLAVRGLLERLARDAGVSPMLPSDPDEIPASVPARTQRGDLWILGEHRLLCGDATEPEDVERLMEGERADVLWTDPPYGVDYVGKTTNALTIAGDGPGGLGELLRRAFAAVGPTLAPGAAIYVCHQSGPGSIEVLQAFGDQGWRLHQGLVWAKDTLVVGHTDYHYHHEPIAFGYAAGGGRRGRGARAGTRGRRGLDLRDRPALGLPRAPDDEAGGARQPVPPQQLPAGGEVPRSVHRGPGRPSSRPRCSAGEASRSSWIPPTAT
jgi:hypothetical protein